MLLTQLTSRRGTLILRYTISTSHLTYSQKPPRIHTHTDKLPSLNLTVAVSIALVQIRDSLMASSFPLNGLVPEMDSYNDPRFRTLAKAHDGYTLSEHFYSDSVVHDTVALSHINTHPPPCVPQYDHYGHRESFLTLGVRFCDDNVSFIVYVMLSPITDQSHTRPASSVDPFYGRECFTECGSKRSSS